MPLESSPNPDEPFGEQEAHGHGNHPQGPDKLGRGRRWDVEPAAEGSDGKGHQEPGKKFQHGSPQLPFLRNTRGPCAAIGPATVSPLGCLAMGREAIHDLIAGRHGQNEGCSRESQRCRKRQPSKTAHDSDTESKEQSKQDLHSSL